MLEPAILTALEGHVATITINRPAKRNALTAQALRDLLEAVRTFAADERVRAMILTGAGGYFCAGDDTANMAHTEEDAAYAEAATGEGSALISALASFPRPVIAAMEGVAVGAGLSIAMACDIRIAATNIRLFAPFGRWGIAADTAISYTMLAVAGLDRTSLFLYTGEEIDGTRAAAMGIVTEALPAEEVLPRAGEIAARIAGNAPLAVAATRRLLKRRFLPGLDEHLPEDDAATLRTLASRDAREAMAAYVERREPRFEGR